MRRRGAAVEGCSRPFVMLPGSLYVTIRPPSAVFDFDFTTSDGQKLHKMIFLNWCAAD